VDLELVDSNHEVGSRIVRKTSDERKTSLDMGGINCWSHTQNAEKPLKEVKKKWKNILMMKSTIIVVR